MSNELLLGDRLEGPRLDAANAVLRSRGFEAMPMPCTLYEIINKLSPIEIRRLVPTMRAIEIAVLACSPDEGSDDAEAA